MCLSALCSVSGIDSTAGPLGEMDEDPVDLSVPREETCPVKTYAPCHLCCFGMFVVDPFD